MTNAAKDFKPVQIISSSAWDEPLEGKEKPVVPLQASSPFGFLLPDVTQEFNASSDPVEVRAWPTDVYRVSEPRELEDFHTVLDALADPAMRENNRNAMFISDAKPGTPTPGFSHWHDIAEGKSQLGFNVAALTASNGPKQFAHLFVVEDSKRKKMVVCGRFGINRAQKDQLAANGVTYVSRHDKNCAAAINQFLADGAKWREQQGLFPLDATGNVMENLLRAFGTYADGVEITKTVSLGKAIRKASSPRRSVQVMANPGERYAHYFR